MPYIKGNLRDKYDKILSEFKEKTPGTEGELNYIISSMLKICWEQSDQSYYVANSLIGVMECAKLEFYRRTVSEYELEKMKENGDI